MEHLCKIYTLSTGFSGEINMMGHKEKLIDGNEYDFIYARKYISFKPREARRIKRMMARRDRHVKNHEILKEIRCG